MSGDTTHDRGSGLAAERTELAWGRSSLALFACGAVVAKGLPTITGMGGRPWLGFALLLLGGLVWLAGVPLAMERARETRAGTRRPAQLHELRPLAYGTAIVGGAALMIAVVFTT